MKRLLTLLFAPLVALTLSACDVDQTEEGEAPEVEVEGGELPEYDVDAPDVELDTTTVIVPELEPDTGGAR